MRKTILIVEDEAALRESLKELFEEEGYAVAAASDGREALEWLTRHQEPALVLLDLIMPIMSGVELYAAMQADERLARLPVLISTSDPSRSPPGALIIKKPFQLEPLLRLIQNLIKD
jgi:two-component system, sensor histidine kinase and response regulator